MVNYTTLEALVETWSPRFVPFFDEDEWEPYDGPRYVANKAMVCKKRGSKRRARYTMEMDHVKPSHSKRTKVNSESIDDRHQICCSK
jgi:hypothetical protein